VKRILVAGGAGFLGSHLVEKLLNQDHKVIVFDNLYSGNINNLGPFFNNTNFSFFNVDIINKILNGLPYIHEIYNLACPASPIHYQKYPIFTWKTNVIGTLNLLDLAKLHDAVFLQASTSEVYGDPQIHPQMEEYWGNVNPIGIRSCYDEGKRAAETLVFDYIRQYNINAKVARIFNTYGPKMAINDGRVVSNFIVQALRNEPITLYGNGSQTRSFCYVNDLVDGLIKLMESEEKGPINLGNPNEFSMIELANSIIEKTNTKSKLEYLPLPSDNPRCRRPIIAKARKLGWEPKIQLSEGLDKTIEYFRGVV
jgi:UDP-glucuronate decarboxylase